MSPKQNVIWLGVSGLTLHLIPCACKWYKPTSEIQTFDSNIKFKVLNDEKRWKNNRMVPIYATYLSSIMTLNWSFLRYLTFQWTELNIQVIRSML